MEKIITERKKRSFQELIKNLENRLAAGDVTSFEKEMRTFTSQGIECIKKVIVRNPKDFPVLHEHLIEGLPIAPFRDLSEDSDTDLIQEELSSFEEIECPDEVVDEIASIEDDIDDEEDFAKGLPVSLVEEMFAMDADKATRFIANAKNSSMRGLGERYFEEHPEADYRLGALTDEELIAFIIRKATLFKRDLSLRKEARDEIGRRNLRNRYLHELHERKEVHPSTKKVLRRMLFS